MMPKIKTHKGTSKRVKLTAKGKVVRGRAFGTHLLAKKSKGRKRNINTDANVTGTVAKNLKKALGV
jgi:large subunit ribosomal protein L35